MKDSSRCVHHILTIVLTLPSDWRCHGNCTTFLESILSGTDGRPSFGWRRCGSCHSFGTFARASSEIVAELEKQFSRLDEAVANLQRVKANLKRYKASVLKAAVEGRLVETEASLAHREGRTYETGEQLLQRILNERRGKWAGKGKYKEATPSVDTEGLHVPEGWVVGSAEQVCSSVRDGTHDTPDYVAIGVPLITSKNLDEHGIDFENVKFISEQDHVEISKRSGVSAGDILFAMIGTIGNPCEVKTEATFSIKNVALFKANSEYLNPTYFCCWLQSVPVE